MSKEGQDDNTQLNQACTTEGLQTNSCEASVGLNQAFHMWEKVVKLGMSVMHLAVETALIPEA